MVLAPVILCFSAIRWHQNGAIPVNGKAFQLCCLKCWSVTWVLASRSILQIEQCHREGNFILPLNILKTGIWEWYILLFCHWTNFYFTFLSFYFSHVLAPHRLTKAELCIKFFWCTITIFYFPLCPMPLSPFSFSMLSSGSW